MRDLPSLPKKVIGSIADVKVVVGRTDSTNAGEFTEDDNLMPEIRVSDKLAAPLRWETWFHEWLHMMEFESGVRLRGEQPDDDVDRLAMAMYACYLRNGWTLPGE